MPISTLQQPALILTMVYDLQANSVNGKTFRQGHHTAFETLIPLSLKKIKGLTENSLCGKERKEMLKRKQIIFYHRCKFATLEVARCQISLVNQDNCDFDSPTSTPSRPPEATW